MRANNKRSLDNNEGPTTPTTAATSAPSPASAGSMAALMERTAAIHAASSPVASSSPIAKRKKLDTKRITVHVLLREGKPFSLAIPDSYLFKEQIKSLSNAGTFNVTIGDVKFERNLPLEIFYRTGCFLPEFPNQLLSSWYLSETIDGFADPANSFGDKFFALANKIVHGITSTPPLNNGEIVIF